VVTEASADELRAHEAMLANIAKRSGRPPLWRELEAELAAELPPTSAAA